MRIGILTGGGDCPGLNAVIRAVCRRSFKRGHQVIGFREGWKGVLEDDTIQLTRHQIKGILSEGGTILRSSGANPIYQENGAALVLQNLKKHDIDALIVVGGEGTMRGAHMMWFEHQVPVIGIPKTIDNDLPGTDATVGFDTALQVVTEALDRLQTTAESHNRIMVCEVMGRTAGWLAFHGGLAGGADVILVPELEMTVEEAAATIHARLAQEHKTSAIVVVGEGYRLSSSTGLFDAVDANKRLDAFGYELLGGVSNHVAAALGHLTGFDTRVTVLGHVQRGGTPSATDRVLASRFGYLAADLADRGSFGCMTALRGNEVVEISLEESTGAARTMPDERVKFLRLYMSE